MQVGIRPLNFREGPVLSYGDLTVRERRYPHASVWSVCPVQPISRSLAFTRTPVFTARPTYVHRAIRRSSPTLQVVNHSAY